MPAYYNEIDEHAADTLENLISMGLIAPGVVDRRSIVDVRPSDLRGFTQCHFFAGIGIWSLALRGAGWPDDRPVWTGSCPCQPFSAAGKGDGFADERHLWPFWFHLIEECRPPEVLGEQVASKDGLGWLDLVFADMEGAGYPIGATDLCAAGVGSPNIRQRLFFGANDLGRDGSLRVEHTSGDGRDERWSEPSGRRASSGRCVGRMGDTIGSGLEGHRGNGDREREREDGRSRLDQLPRQAYLAGWPTPNATDGTGPGRQGRQGGANLQTAVSEIVGPARLTASGEMLIGSSAGMESGGQLSPAMSRWLMGIPSMWDAAAPLSKTKKTRSRACKQCETPLVRKRFNGRLEDNGRFEKGIFCDRSCMADWMEGQIKNLTPQNSRYQSAKTNLNYCEVCQTTEGKFHVHHVNQDPLDNTPSNLRTLCVSCHSRSHSLNWTDDGRMRVDCVYCSEPSMKRGLCFTHLSREKRHGHPLAKMRKIGSDWVLMLEHGGKWFPFHSSVQTNSRSGQEVSTKESPDRACSRVMATRSTVSRRKPSLNPTLMLWMMAA